MKQVLLLFAFVLTSGLVTAQDASAKKSCAKTCAKTCTKSKTASVDASETKVASAMSAADLVADKDENIEKRVCDITGSVAYFQKAVCAKSGSVKMTEVQFDENSNSFVNVSPRDVMSAEKEAKVVKASETTTKSAKKACCASKKASCKKKEGA
ncbi:MAG: hypothetical protein HKO66_09705 [Saprospiraceae bacterium]|nr:hypothetical protein [Bacteroidia bacterium]NNE14262.1 hypothetical protein [Saprospiraceae bacterium]NNL92494.1 hypothetical protein [Saprospiraceae bacterium]